MLQRFEVMFNINYINNLYFHFFSLKQQVASFYHRQASVPFPILGIFQCDVRAVQYSRISPRLITFYGGPYFAKVAQDLDLSQPGEAACSEARWATRGGDGPQGVDPIFGGMEHCCFINSGINDKKHI